jgi:hypothetical protein
MWGLFAFEMGFTTLAIISTNKTLPAVQLDYKLRCYLLKSVLYSCPASSLHPPSTSLACPQVTSLEPRPTRPLYSGNCLHCSGNFSTLLVHSTGACARTRCSQNLELKYVQLQNRSTALLSARTRSCAGQKSHICRCTLRLYTAHASVQKRILLHLTSL